MKKSTVALVMALALGLMVLGTTVLNRQEKIALASSKEDSTTEVFFVQKKLKLEDALLAVPLDSNSELIKGGYILDDKYSIGDIVEVTYWNDDIFAERKISGGELKIVEAKYNKRLSELRK